MRAARLIFEVVISLAFVVSAVFLWSRIQAEGNLLLPSYSFDYNLEADQLYVQGTWRLQDDVNAWANQSSTIHCVRKTNSCAEATVWLTTSNVLMPVAIYQLPVLRWDSDIIIIQ